MNQVLPVQSSQGRQQLPQEQQHLTRAKDKLPLLARLQQVLISAPIDPLAHLPATTLSRQLFPQAGNLWMQHGLEPLQALLQCSELISRKAPPRSDGHRQLTHQRVGTTPKARAFSLAEDLIEAITAVEQGSAGGLSRGRHCHCFGSYATLPSCCRSGWRSPRLCNHSLFQMRER